MEFLGIFVTLLAFVVGLVTTQYRPDQGECILTPSELGPDWYRVQQPVPPGFDDDPSFKPTYIHMPCAPTTVFESSVCGCTNLLSFLFTSAETKRSRITSEPQTNKVSPGDLVKTVDPKDSQPHEPAASLLINTRTGEVRKCPFRASSRGREWYLVREHGDTWRLMECAAGTFFDKIKCTCIHQAVAARDPLTPEDKDIVIIEDAFDIGANKGNTISESLDIKLKDINFGVESNVPYWRRNGEDNSLTKNHRQAVKADVQVTLNNYENGGNHFNNLNPFDMGVNKISDAHRSLLLKLRKGPNGNPFKRKQKAAPLFLDRVMPDNQLGLTNNFDQPLDVSVNIKSNIDKPVVAHLRATKDNFVLKTKAPKQETDTAFDTNNTFGSGNGPVSDVQGSRGQSGHSKELQTLLDANIDVNSLANVLSDVNKQILSKEEVVSNVNPARNQQEKVAQSVENMRHLDDVLRRSECIKKPMPGPDPHYFLLPVPGVGYVPYTCHGNYVYDHSICSCRKAIGETSYNEAEFPMRECNKQPIPEFGQKFFKAHILGFGYIPIGCHGNTAFDEQQCACV